MILEIKMNDGSIITKNVTDVHFSHDSLRVWEDSDTTLVFDCNDVNTLQISQNEATEGMTLKEAIEHFNMNMKDASELLGVPYRTFQNWILGIRKCPEYVERLLVKDLFEKKGFKNWTEPLTRIHTETRNMTD